MFVFALLIVIGVFRLGMAWKGDGAHHLRRCRRCRYVVDAAEVLICPECGHTHRHEREMRFSARVKSSFAIALVLITVGSIGLSVPLMRSVGIIGTLSESALIRVWAVSKHVAPGFAMRCEHELRARTFDHADMESFALQLVEQWNDSRTSNDDEVAEFLNALVVHGGEISATGEAIFDATGGDPTDESAHYFAQAPDSFVDPLETAARRLRGRDDTTPATLLALMSRSSPRACHALVRLCASDAHFRAFALGRAGDVMNATLAKILNDEQARLAERIASADLLFELDALEPSFAPQVLTLLQRSPQEHRAMLASFIASWPSDDSGVRELHPRLVALARADTSPRAEILFALADIFPEIEPSCLSELHEDLQSTSVPVRVRACAMFVLNTSDLEFEPIVDSVSLEPERIIFYDAFAIARRRSPTLERTALADLASSDLRMVDAATRYLKSSTDVSDRQAVWNRLLRHQDSSLREFACERFIEDVEAEPEASSLNACRADHDEWVALAARRLLARRSDELNRSLDVGDEISARFRRLERRAEDVNPLVNELLSARDDRVREATILRLRPSTKELRIDPVAVRQLGSRHLAMLIARLVREDAVRVAAALVIDAVNGVGADLASLRYALGELTQDEREALKTMISRDRAASGDAAKQTLQGLFSDPTGP